MDKYEVVNKQMDKHGLSRDERPAVESLVKAMGYEGLDHLVDFNGFASAREIAEGSSFTCVRDYFLADGWHTRTSVLRKNIENGQGNNSRNQ